MRPFVLDPYPQVSLSSEQLHKSLVQLYRAYHWLERLVPYAFFFFILSATLGIYGFFLGLFIVLSHLASLRSCGLPYLAPISPPFKDLANALFRLPWP
ncbi:spore germination protein [Bacillus pacificus]